MRKIELLDCTLRDGGYVNDWFFGEETIRGFCQKIAKTNVEYFEVGFLKGNDYDPNRSVFPNTNSFKTIIAPKSNSICYLGMLDMSEPVGKENIEICDGTSIDGIRVIFKKDKINEAYDYCVLIKSLGYKLFVNYVCTDQYSDDELIDAIVRFNGVKPDGMSIVDTFGVIKRKQCIHLAKIMDANMDDGIVLCYHAHNNLQQAFANAEALVDLQLDRNLVVDACVFGMGRGAGNLNLELFAEYMNDTYDAHYRIEPMLEIMDEYLNNIYRTKFWGYSLPLYLSAKNGCHPNYAIYLAEKNSLTEKSFDEILKSISSGDKIAFSKDKAEKYYREYLQNYVDDKEVLQVLAGELKDKDIIILAPGSSILKAKELIKNRRNADTVIIALNFLAEEYKPDYIFSSNMRRYINIEGKTNAKCITTSNMRGSIISDYKVNFASCISLETSIIDNSGLMLLRLLNNIGIKKVSIAGMDGYIGDKRNDYCYKELEYDFSKEANDRNCHIEKDLQIIARNMEIDFITPTMYKI